MTILDEAKATAVRARERPQGHSPRAHRPGRPRATYPNSAGSHGDSPQGARDHAPGSGVHQRERQPRGRRAEDARSRCRSLPICGADDRLHGIVTDREIVVKSLAEGRDPAQDTLFWVSLAADVNEVLREIEDHQIKRLP